MLDSLDTPCLLLDRKKLISNIDRMNGHLAALGVPLRPHLKTAKSADVARLAVAGQPGGITVSTLREAEYFLSEGFRDILYAVCISPQKLPQVAGLMNRGADITIIADAPATAMLIGEAGVRLGVVFRVLVELDSDGHRGGLAPDSAELIETALRLAQGPGSRFAGIMTHAGEGYNRTGPDEIAAMAQQERNAVLAAAQRLAAAGLKPEMLSAGSTPTALCARDLSGLTEMRAGVYMFQDLIMAELGLCETSDIALSVLATVIGHKAELNRLIVDAGGLALSKDRGLGRYGYGLVCDTDGKPYADLIVADTNQEHGLITSTGGPIPYDRFPVGARVRILPNHACMTGAAYDAYHVLEESRITARWGRCNGW